EEIDFEELLLKQKGKEKPQMIRFLIDKAEARMSPSEAFAILQCDEASYTQKCRLLDSSWATEAHLNDLINLGSRRKADTRAIRKIIYKKKKFKIPNTREHGDEVDYKYR